MEELRTLLGPFPEQIPIVPETLERMDCGTYIREKIAYEVEPGDKVSAYVCVPKNLTAPAPAIFCHHQHHGQFDIGKSEVVGLTPTKPTPASSPGEAMLPLLRTLSLLRSATGPAREALHITSWQPGLCKGRRSWRKSYMMLYKV